MVVTMVGAGEENQVKMYTISQIVDLVSVSDKTVRRAIQSGKLEATKEPGPRGMEYRVTQEALDVWVAMRQDDDQDNVHSDEQGSVYGVQGGLVPWTHVQELQDKLHGAIYRAGQAEGRVQELDAERERLLRRVEDLEQQLQKQQVDVLERLEAREKAFIEFVQAWREVATAREEKRKPWWKFWGQE